MLKLKLRATALVKDINSQFQALENISYSGVWVGGY